MSDRRAVNPSSRQTKNAAHKTLARAEEISVEEASHRYRGQWILMKVTAFDQYQNPSVGEVLAASTKRERISNVLARQPPSTQENPYYIFRAPPHADPAATALRLYGAALQALESGGAAGHS